MRTFTVAGPLLAAWLLLSACGSGQIPLIPVIDTPEYHVATGQKMLELDKIPSAFREFDRAVELDPKYSPAYVGLGISHARVNASASALAALEKADRYARGKGQEVAVWVGYMRFYTISGDNYSVNWLTRVEGAFNKAVLIDAKNPAPFYYLGLAYKGAGQNDQAAKMFYRVLELGGGYEKEAAREYDIVEAKP